MSYAGEIAPGNPDMIASGNINLLNRPRVRNSDGSISTVRSASFNFDGNEVLLPTVSDDGRILTDDETVQQYKQTGGHLGIFRTPEAATAYAEKLHLEQEKFYLNKDVSPAAPKTVFPPRLNLAPALGKAGMADYPSLSNQALLDFPGFRAGLPPEQKAAVDGQFARSPDQALTERKMQDILWLSEQTGWPLDFVAANRDAVVSAWGRANNIPDWQDPAKFHAFIKTQAEKDREEHLGMHGMGGDTEEAVKLRKDSLVEFAYQTAHEDAYNQMPADNTVDQSVTTWAKDQDETAAWMQYQAKAKTQKWWRPENVDTYHQAFHDAYQRGAAEARRAADVFERLKPVLTEAVTEGRKSAKKAYGTAAVLGDEKQFEEAVHMMRGLSPVEQTLVLERVAAWTPGKDDSGRALDEDISTSGTRGLVSLKQSAIDQMQKIAGGRSREEIDREQNLRKQLVNAVIGKLDPVDKSSWWRQSLNSAAESVGPMLTTAIPYAGPVIMIGAYASDAENKMVSEGVPVDAARNMSFFVGPAQAAADMVQLKLFKQLGLGKLFGGITAKAAGAYGVRVAGTTIVETVIEIGQDDLIPAVTQDVARWWDKSIPGIKWQDVAGEVWTKTPELLLTMLPIAALAGGAAHVADVKNARSLVSNPERLDMLGYRAEDIAKIQAAATDSAAVAAFRDGWARRTPKMAGDFKGAGISEGLEAVAKAEEAARIAASPSATADTAGVSISSEQGQKPELSDSISGTPADFPLSRDENGWFVQDGEKRIEAGSFDAAKYIQNQLRMAVTQEGAQAWLDIADDLTGRKVADTATLSGRAVEVSKTSEGTAVTTMKPGGALEAVKLSPESLRQLDAQMDAAGLTLATIQGSNEAIRDTLGKVNQAITANIGPDGVLTLIHEAAERQFRAGRVTKAETQAAAKALLPVFAHDAQISGELQNIVAGDTTSAGAQETMMGIIVSNELGQRKDGRRFKPGALTAGFMDALRIQGGEKARSGVRKYAAMAKAIGQYFKALFSGMKALAKARKGGADLKDFDAFADKLLGIDPDKRAAVESAKEAAKMAEGVTGEKIPLEKSDMGIPISETGSESGSSETGTKEVPIHTLKEGKITVSNQPATKELLRELSKQEGQYKALIDCLKK